MSDVQACDGTINCPHHGDGDCSEDTRTGELWHRFSLSPKVVEVLVSVRAEDVDKAREKLTWLLEAMYGWTEPTLSEERLTWDPAEAGVQPEDFRDWTVWANIGQASTAAGVPPEEDIGTCVDSYDEKTMAMGREA